MLGLIAQASRKIYYLENTHNMQQVRITLTHNAPLDTSRTSCLAKLVITAVNAYINEFHPLSTDSRQLGPYDGIKMSC